MRKLKFDNWIAMQRRRKWRWVQKLAKTTDSDWMVMATRWDPTIDKKLNARRRPGRPKTRWIDNIANHVTKTTINNEHNNPATSNANSNDDDAMMNDPTPIDSKMIIQMARNAAAWAAMEEGFVNNVF